MIFQHQFEKGFSILEILIILSLSTALVISGTLTFSKVKRSEELFSTTLHIVNLLEKARAKSIANEKDRAWKVVIIIDRASLQDEYGNLLESYQLPEAYSIQGPTNEIIFKKIDGFVQECPSNCLFEVREVSGNLYHQFNILNSGAVEY